MERSQFLLDDFTVVLEDRIDPYSKAESMARTQLERAAEFIARSSEIQERMSAGETLLEALGGNFIEDYWDKKAQSLQQGFDRAVLLLEHRIKIVEARLAEEDVTAHEVEYLQEAIRDLRNDQERMEAAQSGDFDRWEELSKALKEADDTDQLLEDMFPDGSDESDGTELDPETQFPDGSNGSGDNDDDGNNPPGPPGTDPEPGGSGGNDIVDTTGVNHTNTTHEEWTDTFDPGKPVILDLDGDGVEVSVDSTVFFGFDDDGYFEQSGWAATDDAYRASLEEEKAA